jgi:hypothetical protein
MSSVTRMKGSFLVQAPRNCKQTRNERHDSSCQTQHMHLSASLKRRMQETAIKHTPQQQRTCTAFGWCTRRRISISPRKSPRAISLEPLRILAATSVPYLSDGPDKQGGQSRCSRYHAADSCKQVADDDVCPSMSSPYHFARCTTPNSPSPSFSMISSESGSISLHQQAHM